MTVKSLLAPASVMAGASLLRTLSPTSMTRRLSGSGAYSSALAEVMVATRLTTTTGTRRLGTSQALIRPSRMGVSIRR